MNQLENCQARYRSNTWMGRTRTEGPNEFEPLKFDCILANDECHKAATLSGILSGSALFTKEVI